MKSLNSAMNNLKTGMTSISQRVSIALFIICFAVMGCTLIKLKKEVNRSLESTALIGRIHAKITGNGPIIVAARSMEKGKGIAHYTVLHDSGEYELMVDQGDYYVFAFWDKNSNLIYDAGEPAGQYGDPKWVRVPPVGVVFDIDIVIPEEGGNIAIPHGSEISSVKPQKLQSRQAGAIADLNDERFSEKYGTKGFWEPMSFYKQFGGNIFFLEAYDPEKTPILFIHGAGGTPKGWWYFVDNIDRTRFQPWFFYYPTGARIDAMSYLLLWKLTNLQTKYQFNKIYITAHSMGGLVARSFIVNYGGLFPYAKLLISLATPWGGDKMAEYGVQQSPAVIPSWIDMQPEGDFIKSLYRKKLPDHVSFYMFYGHRGNRNPFSSNNDGTIALSSLLDHRPQSEAKMNYAFNEDHASIVFSKDVLAQYNTILNEFDEKQNASIHRSGGYLKIHFTYNYDFDGVRPNPALILSPMGKKDAETVIFLNNDDHGRILGPFPSGDYSVSMIASAAKPKKNDVPVSIERNKTKNLDFVFTPDGVIRGCVTASLEPEDKHAGMPDYKYRSVDRKIKMQSITLEGNGIHRILQPIEGEDVDNYDYLISRADFSYNTCFGFFGLPAGDYELTIKAQGYKPIVKNYSVTPGIIEYFRITALTPD
ncbi:MAG: alpha/beta hydrolase [Deltaproteobacteria bacterium]|nr:alpha/beta hydrolase [Deltaproteobacteria bacterium]